MTSADTEIGAQTLLIGAAHLQMLHPPTLLDLSQLMSQLPLPPSPDPVDAQRPRRQGVGPDFRETLPVEGCFSFFVICFCLRGQENTLQDVKKLSKQASLLRTPGFC